MFFASHKIGAAQYLRDCGPKHVSHMGSSLQPARRGKKFLKMGRGIWFRRARSPRLLMRVLRCRGRAAVRGNGPAARSRVKIHKRTAKRTKPSPHEHEEHR